MEDNIKVDKEELYKQAMQEIENQEHSFCIHIGVPNISIEYFSSESKDAPIADVHAGEGGVNSMTRAMSVIVLDEVRDTLLSDETVQEAYTLLKIMTRQKTVKLKDEEKEIKDDTD